MYETHFTGDHSGDLTDVGFRPKTHRNGTANWSQKNLDFALLCLGNLQEPFNSSNKGTSKMCDSSLEKSAANPRHPATGLPR